LRAEGFFSARVEYRIETPAVKRSVRLVITPGQRFRLSNFRFQLATPAALLRLPSPEELGWSATVPARIDTIQSIERAAVRWLQDHGYPFARFESRELLADRKAHTVEVTAHLSAGARGSFGAVRFEGLRRVEEDYLLTYRTWSPAAEFSRTRLDEFADRLMQTGLFQSVNAVPAWPAGRRQASVSTSPGRSSPQRAAPLRIDLHVEEGKPRSVGVGARFSTDLGPATNAFFEHRNLLRRNERGRVSATAGLAEQALDTSFRKPQFLRAGQTLLGDLIFSRETGDAFREVAIRGGVSIERRLTPRLLIGAGISAETADVSGSNREGQSYLLGLPLSARYDTSNSLLDPSDGYRVFARLTPYGGSFDGNALLFPVLDVQGSIYFPFGRHVLALRSRIASLLLTGRDEVPAPKRLYSGGGSSVRGYAARFVGPLDAEGDPLGGRSAVEAAIEWRWRLGDTFAVVPFLDAGSVSASSLPDLADGVHLGAGLGIRYYTPVGPVRADIAVPIDPRPADDAFQLYISIGQAF